MLYPHLALHLCHDLKIKYPGAPCEHIWRYCWCSLFMSVRDPFSVAFPHLASLLGQGFKDKGSNLPSHQGENNVCDMRLQINFFLIVLGRLRRITSWYGNSLGDSYKHPLWYKMHKYLITSKVISIAMIKLSDIGETEAGARFLIMI